MNRNRTFFKEEQKNEMRDVLLVKKINIFNIDKREWDATAIKAGSSYKMSFKYIVQKTYVSFLTSKIMIFEIFLKEENKHKLKKVGQFVIERNKSYYEFIDKLVLLPEYEYLWSDAISAALLLIGRGRYLYGWNWNLEESKIKVLEAIQNVEIISEKKIHISFIDFSRWKNWKDYYREISTNSKRNAKKAELILENISIEYYFGYNLLIKIPDLMNNREKLYRNKSLPFDKIRLFFSYVSRVIIHKNNAYGIFCQSSENVYSSLSGIEFGKAFYFLDGGRSGDSSGASWLLMIKALETFYQKYPTGKFIMGYVDYDIHDEGKSSGLIRSRMSCRAEEMITSKVLFYFKG